MIDVFFGTTTPRNGLSQGIYHAGFDTERGKFSQPTLAAKMSGCGFLALHPNGNVLYSTGSPDGGAEITAFRVSGKPGELTLTMIGSQPTSDGGAAHLTVDRTGKLLLSAQYGGGSTSIYPLAEDGAIAAPGKPHEHSELATPAGSGVVPRRQDAPHAHWCGTSPDNRFAFVPDLGMDKVVIWKIDAKSPSLKHHGFGVCPPGGGPRHMKFSPDGKTIYVLNELSLSVTRFAYDAASGSMTALQTLPVLSEAVKAKETFNSASEIRVHPSGRFVYSANRGNDSITAMNVDAAGALSVVEVEPIRGGWPRNFNITPDGKWLIAAGRDSNTATVFQIDQASGQLQFARETAMVPTPICVLIRP